MMLFLFMPPSSTGGSYSGLTMNASPLRLRGQKLDDRSQAFPMCYVQDISDKQGKCFLTLEIPL